MIKKLLLLAIVIGLALWIRQSEYAEFLTFEALKENSDSALAYVSNNYLTSAVAFVLIYVAVAGLNIPGAVILSLAGGYLFGAFTGTALAVSGATAGASISFLLSRYVLGNTLNKKYAKQLDKLNSELNSNGYLYMLTLRLIPVFPFFLINILAGLTKLKLLTFIWTSFVGMIPGGFVFVYAGSRLKEIESVGDIFSPGMLSAFVLLGLLMLIPIGYNKIKSRG